MIRNLLKKRKTRFGVYLILILIADIFIGGSFSATMSQINKGAAKGFDTITYFVTNIFVNLNPITFIKELCTEAVARSAFLNAFIWVSIIVAVLCLMYEIKNYFLKGEYEGTEHGSSGWADGDQYQILNRDTGIILAQHNYLTTDNKFINKNVLIIGGAGSRKSRGYIMPNMMQMLGSYIVTDPKGENFDTAAGFLRENGYEVRCINLVNPECSDSYDPLWHIGSSLDVDIVSDALIKNTSKGSTNEDPFWPQAERALLNSCIYYLLSECPKEEQSLASCLAMVRAGENFDWMDDVFMRLPFEHMARKSYETFRLAVDKTRAGVLVGLATRLNVFDTPQISSITGSSSIDIDAMGEKKMATFVITPDSHSAFNFIPTMFFGQVLQRLYYKADENSSKRADGKCTLDIPVFFLLDEFANTGQIPDFNQKLSTSRSRNINISIVLQSIDQLQDLYKDIYENIMANCDTHLFLGSQAVKTCEYISKSLGEATINKKQVSMSGKMDGIFTQALDSQSISDQSMARALMTIDELKRLDLDTSIVMVKGMRPIKAKKYDISMHPKAPDIDKYKINHNDPTLNHRAEFKIVYPYGLKTGAPDNSRPGQEVGEEPDVEDNLDEDDIQKKLEAKFDELFGSLNS